MLCSPTVVYDKQISCSQIRSVDEWSQKGWGYVPSRQDDLREFGNVEDEGKASKEVHYQDSR